MFELRVLPSNYLGVGLAIATSLAANLGSARQAQAQAPNNLNLQTQLDIIMPPVSPQLPLPTQPGSNPFAGLDQTLVRLSTGAVFVQTKALRSVALRIQPPAKNAAVLAGKKNVPPLSAQEAKDIVEGCLSKSDSANCTEAQRRKFETELAFFAVNPNPTVVTRQPQKVQISFPFNPSYETNTLKSLGNNNSPGESAGFGGNVVITTGIKDR